MYLFTLKYFLEVQYFGTVDASVKELVYYRKKYWKNK